MKIRSAITILIAIAWMSTQIAMGFAHGTTSHDHSGTAHHSTISNGANHHLDVEQDDVADQNLHSHLKKQLDKSNGFSALQACDTACTAIFANGWILSANDLHLVRAGFIASVNQGFIELPTPPPNNRL